MSRTPSSRLLVSLAVGLACVLPVRLAVALPGETWLVAIGNNRGDAEDVELLYAERDALELTKVLWSEGGLSPRRTVLLLGESATVVRRELLKVNQALRGHEGPASLVVFYSGHADAESLHLGRTSLPMDELRALVASSSAGVRVLFVDACRSGRVTRVKGTDPAESFALDFDDRSYAEGLAIITSSASGETSQESDQLRASFFSHHLTVGLRGAADRNGDGDVTLGEAYSYTYRQTLRSSGKTLSLQHPTYEYDVKGKGELVLTSPGRDRRNTASLRLGEPQVYVIFEKSADGLIAAEVAPAREGATLALPPGPYLVVERRASEQRHYAVTLRVGALTDLATTPYRSVAYDRLVRARDGGPRLLHGMTLMSGARGETISGEGPTPQLALGYSLDTPWLTFGVRLRGSTTTGDDVVGGGSRRHYELGVGISLQRFIDLDWVSLAFGVLFEGVYHTQTFDLHADAPTRHSAGFGFTGLFSVERQLPAGVAIRVEGGPVVSLFERATSSGGEQVGSELESPLTWWVAGGIVWRL